MDDQKNEGGMTDTPNQTAGCMWCRYGDHPGDEWGYVEAAPERLAPILAELDATHEAAVRRVIAQFGDDSHALATEIVRLRGELMASVE